MLGRQRDAAARRGRCLQRIAVGAAAAAPRGGLDGPAGSQKGARAGGGGDDQKNKSSGKYEPHGPSWQGKQSASARRMGGRTGLRQSAPTARPGKTAKLRFQMTGAPGYNQALEPQCFAFCSRPRMNNSDDQSPPPPPPIPLLHLPEIKPPKTAWWRNWKIMVPVWLAIGGMVWLGLYFNVDHRVIAGTVVVVGVLSNAFAWLVGIVVLVPIIGPLIVKVLSIGFIWLLNAIGYLVALVA